MTFSQLPTVWQTIFGLEWQSLREGSKAIGAVITDSEGNIISEGRNRICEYVVPNAAVAHAETEAVRNLDIAKYPDLSSYTLYTGLEPCLMCMGTLILGHIRNVVIAAHDDYGGTMDYIPLIPFAARKNIKVTYMEQGYGDMQRGLQTVRELLFNQNEQKRIDTLEDFCVYNRKGVEAAAARVEEGFFNRETISAMSIETAFNKLAEQLF